MTTRERIRAEIENVPEEKLGELYLLIRRFAEENSTPAPKPGALSRLKQIKIRAPEDFAVNLDLSLSGAKPLATESDLR